MAGKLWTRDELIVAFNLYCKLPFGKCHRSNRQIIDLAEWLGRTPSAISMKLVNFASFDPAHQRRGVVGLGNTSKSDQAIWDEFDANWDALALESEVALAALRPGGSTLIDSVSPQSVDEIPIAEAGETETERTVTVRLRQRFFRLTMLACYGGRCCICALDSRPLLVASHIVPLGREARISGRSPQRVALVRLARQGVRSRIADSQ